MKTNIEHATRTREEKHMTRRGIYVTAAAVLVLFAAMTVYLCRYALVNSRELFANDYNARAQLMLDQNTRGRILTENGEVLAQTLRGADGSEYRDYPYGSLFAHVVGYPVYGKAGIEKAEDYDLVRTGIPLSEKAECDRRGEKYPGNEVVTTLVPQIQQAASDAMGIYRGAIVVTEPSTGKILAMVSKPDYDPNRIRELWSGLLADNESGTLLNRAAQGMYPPGSTFKILDAAEYLREHPEEAASYSFSCSGTFTADGETIHCYHNQSHGQVDFRTSFAKSCNSSFANIGLSLDKTSYASFLKTMMFGEELPFELPSARSRVDLAADTPTAQMLQIAIGQGTTSMSPLHLNMITAAVANGGVIMRPYVVQSVRTASGSVIRETAPSEYRRVMEEGTAAQMRLLMEDVVKEGTATKLQGYGYTAAGKTGSAEFSDEDPNESHAWFTGYAPAEDPQFCVTVILEGAGSGGSYAVPMARTVLDACFAARGQ